MELINKFKLTNVKRLPVNKKSDQKQSLLLGNVKRLMDI